MDKDLQKLNEKSNYNDNDLKLLLKKVSDKYSNAEGKMFNYLKKYNEAVKHYNEGIDIYNEWFGGCAGGHPDNFKPYHQKKNKTVKGKPNYHRISALKKWIIELNDESELNHSFDYN
tara:strand:- start:89 stop:439 length:351 start_codon:yes stop_codon:yes gene_type:complete